LTVAVALGVGSWALAQTPSSSSQQQLPPAPRSPKSLAECDAYQKQLDDQMAQIGQQHSACLDSFKADRQGDNNLICSRSECQSLHTLLYGPRKTAGEQQIASCQAAVQRYQARSAAQQQGIQTLGNAIDELLAPSPSTPMDSQSDLASYENQQKGQAVIGDESTTSSSPDGAATNVMNSGVPDAGPSVQSQLDSALSSDVDEPPASETNYAYVPSDLLKRGQTSPTTAFSDTSGAAAFSLFGSALQYVNELPLNLSGGYIEWPRTYAQRPQPTQCTIDNPNGTLPSEIGPATSQPRIYDCGNIPPGVQVIRFSDGTCQAQ
jgi:hypothetical protein